MLMQAITAQQRHQRAQAPNVLRTTVTDDEQQTIYALTRQGLSVKAIADKLGIEYGTAYKYRRHEIRRMKKNGSI